MSEILETLLWLRKNYASAPTAEINARIDAAMEARRRGDAMSECIHEFELHEKSGIHLCKHCRRMKRKLDWDIEKILEDTSQVGPEHEADIALCSEAIAAGAERFERRKALWSIMLEAAEHKTYSELRMLNRDLLDALAHLRVVMANHEATPEEILALGFADKAIAEASKARQTEEARS